MAEGISLSGKYLDYHDEDADDDNVKDEKFWKMALMIKRTGIMKSCG